jgi:hypothetical protein
MQRGLPGGYLDQWFGVGRARWWRGAAKDLLVRFIPLTAVYIGAAMYFGGGVWWSTVGGLVGMAAGGLAVAWEHPPRRIEDRRFGAEGERATARELLKLENEGWQVKHDIDLGRGNIDHLLVGPGGVFLLETKRFRRPFSVGPKTDQRWSGKEAGLRRRALEISDHVRSTAGTRQWVQSVVVVWGDFRQRLVERDRVVYVHGDELVRWLRSRPVARTELEMIA